MLDIFLFASLLVKHAIADLFLQSFRTPTDKSRWSNPGLHLHSLDHGILTTLILIAWPQVPFVYALGLGLLDYALHVVIDNLKTRTVNYFQVDRNGKLFWRIQAVDQALHYLTYLLLVVLAKQFGLL